MNSECCSVQRVSGIEIYVRFRRFWRSDSQRRMPRETEKHKQKIFHPKQFRLQRRVHFVALMDIRHTQNYEYILESIRKSNLKCGHKYEYILGNVRKTNLKCCEYSQPTVEYHEYGSQDSNNVETKMNLQACIGKPLPSRCG